MNNNIPNVKNTVGYNLFKHVFLIYLFATFIITSIHVYSEYKNEESKILKDMKNIEKSFKNQLSIATWFVDNKLIEEIIYGILSHRSIIGVTIKFNQYDFIHNFGTVDIKNKQKSRLLLTNKVKNLYKQNLYEYSFNLENEKYNNNKSFGKIIIYSDKYIIYDNIKNNFILIIINAFIKTFILWIVFLFFANKYLTIPFFKMINTMNNINFSQIDNAKLEYNENNKNEFDYLKISFNKMVNKLSNSYTQITSSNQRNIDLNENLEEKIKERTYELKESNDELEQTIDSLKITQNQLVEAEKMASLGGLVAGVAHEINTPVGIGLTGITHFLRITEDIKKLYNEDYLSKEELEEYLKTSEDLAKLINTNLSRTANLVKSFKQVAVDQTSEEKRVFDIKSYIEEVLFSINNITKQMNLQIEVHCNDDVTVNSYPGAISQIITNLIINSIKHGFNDKEEGIIIIEVDKTENEISFVYKDNGKGIKEENVDKVFEPFFTTNRENGGTGLGLNIVYNIVKSQLGGEIKCESKENQGVKFIVNF